MVLGEAVGQQPHHGVKNNAAPATMSMSATMSHVDSFMQMM